MQEAKASIWRKIDCFYGLTIPSAARLERSTSQKPRQFVSGASLRSARWTDCL